MRARGAGRAHSVSEPKGCAQRSESCASSRDVGVRVQRIQIVRCHRVSRVVCILSGSGVGLVWLALPSVARADLSLVFGSAAAHPGDRVEVLCAERSGRLVSYPGIRRFRLYLVPMDRAKSGRHQVPSGRPTDPRWIPLGPLRHTSAGVIRFAFVVPAVRPGDYTVGFWCRQCAPPRGATFTSAYPGTRWRDARYSKVLRISAVERRASLAPERGISPSELVLAAVALGLLGGGGIWLSRRRALGHSARGR